MIHNLEINPTLTAKEVKKLARKLAMTGGYEISLNPKLSTQDLDKIASEFIRELQEFQQVNSHTRASNAFRILKLVSQHNSTDTTTRAEVIELLDKFSN